MSDTSEQKNAVTLAVLQTEVSYLKTSLAELKASNAAQDAKLDQVLAQMAEARGGWKTLLLIGGASGTVGGAIAWTLQHLKG